MIFMSLDKRKTLIFFTGDDLRQMNTMIEEGDEATLYHEGNLIMATITSTKQHAFKGIITRSAYEPDLHPYLIPGKDIKFLEENIFGISKSTL